jgi:hypothetical protein
MKSFITFISEAQSFAQWVARNAEKRKAPATGSPRSSFPWMQNANMVPGWWHPTKQWFTFAHGKQGYHVTHLVNNLSKFGISEKELMAAAAKEAQRPYWDNELRKQRGHNLVDAERVIHMIKNENIDNSYPIMALAYKRGWLKAYGGKFHTGDRGGAIEGSDKKSIKAAIREIEQAASMAGIDDIRIDATERSNTTYEPKFFVLDSKFKRDGYMRQ